MQRLVAPEEMLMQVPEYSLFAASCWCWLCFFSFFVSVPFAGSIVCVSESWRHQGKPVLARKGIVAVFFFPSQVLEALFVGLASTTSALTLRTIPLVRCAALSRQFSTASPTPRRREGGGDTDGGCKSNVCRTGTEHHDTEPSCSSNQR
jgi:hypothetical protein